MKRVQSDFTVGTHLLCRPETWDADFCYNLQNQLHDSVGYTPKGGIIDRIQSRRLLLVLENGSPGGYVTFTHRRDGITHLPQLAVHPDLWRTQCGTDLLNWLIDEARRHSSYAITLKSAVDLPANLFWPTVGFRPINAIDGPRRRLIVWARALYPNGALPDKAPAAARPRGGIIARRRTSVER